MRPSFRELLEALAVHDVEMIVVGGVAAIIEGAPVTTLDLDIVYRVDQANLGRLEAALGALDARYRDPAGRTIVPTRERLASHRTNLLLTRHGPLDVLQEIGDSMRFDDLLPRTARRLLGTHSIAVLDLATVIATKEAADREKDRATLPLLRETLRMKRQTGEPEGS